MKMHSLNNEIMVLSPLGLQKIREPSSSKVSSANTLALSKEENFRLTEYSDLQHETDTNRYGIINNIQDLGHRHRFCHNINMNASPFKCCHMDSSAGTLHCH